jgi:hypothetical protein
MWVGLKIRKLIPVSLALSLLGSFQTASSQEGSTTPGKFDEFANERSSTVRARLDLFAKALSEQNLAGSLIGYRSEGGLRGSFLRELEGYREYLVNSRGVQPDRIDIVDAGVRQSSGVELWLRPVGTNAHQISKRTLIESDLPLQFDSLGVGVGCVGEYTLVLEDPEDALRIFVQALKENSNVKGFVLVHPSRSAPAEAQRLAANSKAFFVGSGIPRERIFFGVEAQRHCAELNLWLAPAQLAATTRGIKSFFQSQLIREAEQHQYSIRLVGFVGHQFTSDSTLRRRVPGLQEGERFTVSNLEENLVSLSKLRTIRPVGLADVDVFLDKTNRLIDMWIFVDERRRAR